MHITEKYLMARAFKAHKKCDKGVCVASLAQGELTENSTNISWLPTFEELDARNNLQKF